MEILDHAPALDVLADAVIASDESNRVVYMNPAAERLLGWSRAELVGQPLTALMPERMRPLHENGFRRYITTGQTKIMGVPVRVPALRKDGTEIDVELTLSALPAERKRVVVASLRDLRDRVELERQLLAQQRLAAQNAVMAVFAESERVDDAACRMLRAIGEALHWQIGNFWVLDGERFTCTASWRAAEIDAATLQTLCDGVTFAKGEGLPGRVWQTGKPAWIADLRADNNFPRLMATVNAGLLGAFAFPVLFAGRVMAVAEFFSTSVQAIDDELLRSAETLGRQIGQFIERIEAKNEVQLAEARARFLADASATLASSLDYERTLRRVGELAVPAIADWCTVAAIDKHGTLRRIAVVHRDPSKANIVSEYEAGFPPEQHRAGQHLDVLKQGKPIFSQHVGDAELAAAAQDEHHLRILRELGCASCIMVPMALRGEAVGVISLMRCEAHRAFTERDVLLAQELARRAEVAVDNARLFRTVEQREKWARFVLESSAILNGSLDYEAMFERLATLVVPRFADWCSVDVPEDGRLRNVAVAHVDASKVEFAREIQKKYPSSLDDPTGVAQVLRTAKSELYADIPDELLQAAARDPEHLRLSRALGLRSALIVPLTARGQTLGALTLVWAESNHRYSRDDIEPMEELGRRAGVALDNARLYAEAQRAVKLREEFLSIASHELKTPLTSLQLQVGRLQRTVARERKQEPAIERLANRIEPIDLHVRRLEKLIEDLLDVSRLSAGQFTLNIEEVDFSDVVQEVIASYRDQMSSAGCTLSTNIETALLGNWDRMRLERVVSNFLSNALKYGAGKPIEIIARRRGDSVVLSVRDEGIGIAPEHHAQIFERWERVAPSEHYGGLGLGLWIVRLFVDRMGGTVSVQSEHGKGATFTMELPIGRATDVSAH